MTLELRPTSPTTAQEVQRFEAAFGFSLPADYRHFLLAKNGGRCLRGGLVRAKATGQTITTLHTLLGLLPEYAQSLEDHLADLEDRIVEGTLPIAYDEGGSLLLLDCSQLDFGKVYFASLETAVPGEPVPRKELLLVADSFSEFLEKIAEEYKPK